jgi:osmotically-inducible protein OsmY
MKAFRFALRLATLAFALSACAMFAQNAQNAPKAATPPSASEKSDNELVDRVRVRLSLDVDVNGGALDVNAKDGVVTLRGAVRNDRAKKKAEKITAKVKGVKKVINEINVSPNI